MKHACRTRRAEHDMRATLLHLWLINRTRVICQTVDASIPPVPVQLFLRKGGRACAWPLPQCWGTGPGCKEQKRRTGRPWPRFDLNASYLRIWEVRNSKAWVLGSLPGSPLCGAWRTARTSFACLQPGRGTCFGQFGSRMCFEISFNFVFCVHQVLAMI